MIVMWHAELQMRWRHRVKVSTRDDKAWCWHCNCGHGTSH